MKLSLSAALTCAALPVYADLEADRLVGTCAMYLKARNNPASTAVMMLADDSQRAMVFALMWAKELEKQKNDKSRVDDLVKEATAACEEIGIKQADYE